jgi:opacity protein-like surface antigen
VDYKTGYGLLGALGYGYANGWRTELELNWRKNNVDTAKRNGAALTSPGGDLGQLGVFGNMLYDFNVGMPFTPYLGLGLGWLRSDLNLKGNGITAVDDTQNQVGYQLIAGAAYPIAQQLKLTLDYRFMSTFQKPEYSTSSAYRTSFPGENDWSALRVRRAGTPGTRGSDRDPGRCAGPRPGPRAGSGPRAGPADPA